MTDYRDFQPKETTRTPEAIEWSIHYAFNAPDVQTPRILLIGDSICNGYHAAVRDRLAEYANITFWASSKCVTDPGYFRELDFILDSGRFDLISFNNGLHSLGTNRMEWETAYRAAVQFIRAKCSDAKLFLTLCTPLNDTKLDAISRELNDFTRKLAEDAGLPIIDLYTAMMTFDKDTSMSDVYHWKAPAVAVQADIICSHMTEQLHPGRGTIQYSTETGPDGVLK